MRCTYSGPFATGIEMTVTLNKNAPNEDTFSIPEGVVLRRGSRRGHVPLWGQMVYHLRVLLENSPEARLAVRAMLENLP